MNQTKRCTLICSLPILVALYPALVLNPAASPAFLPAPLLFHNNLPVSGIYLYNSLTLSRSNPESLSLAQFHSLSVAWFISIVLKTYVVLKHTVFILPSTTKTTSTTSSIIIESNISRSKDTLVGRAWLCTCR